VIDQSVNVAYTADTSQYMASMGEMITATSRYGQVADGVVGRISKVGVAVTRTVTDWATLGKSMNAATQTAAAYQQAMSQLEARTVVAGGNFKDLSKQVRQFARDVPGGLQNAVQQVDALAKMGVTANQNLVPLARTMTQIGAANGEMGPQLTQSFAQLNRTFKSLDVTSVDRIGASLTKVASTTGASASSIVEFSNAVAPLAQTLGMTKTQVLGFSAAFSRSGQDGYLAANVMNKMMGDMERSAREGTGELTTYATAVGKTTTQFASLVKSNPGEALAQVFDALSKGGSDSIRTLEKMGFEGPRAMKTLTAVAQAGGVREAINASMSGYGGDSTAKGAEAAFGGLNDELSKTQESMTQLVEASGRPLLGFLTDVTQRANTMASAFAGFAGGDFAQTLATVTMFGAGIAGTAGKVAGATAGMGTAKQVATMLPGMVAMPMARGVDAIGRYRNPLMLGGVGALGVGMVGGNSSLAALGSAALLLSNFGSGSAMMRGLRNISGRAVDAFYSSAMRQAGVPLRDSLEGRKAIRDSEVRTAALKASGMSQNKLDSWFRGNDTAMSKALDRLPDELEKKGVLLDSTAGRRVATGLLREEYNASNPARLAGMDALKSTGAGLGGAGGAAMSALSALLFSPAGAVAGGLAAGVGGYMMYSNYKDQTKQWRDPGFNATRTLSEQYGIALAPVSDFSKVMSESVKTVDTWNEAMNISGNRAKQLEEMYRTGDTENVRMRIAGESNEDEVLAQVQAAGNSQSPAFMSALLNDVAAQRGVEYAQRIADRVRGTQSQVQPVVDSIGQIASDAETGWWSMVSPNYTGQKENIEQAKGGVEQLRAQQTQAYEVGGTPARAAKQLEQFDAVREEMLGQLRSGKFDEQLALEVASAVVPAGKQAEFVDAIKADYDAETAFKLPSWTGVEYSEVAPYTSGLRQSLVDESKKPIDPERFNNAAELMSKSGQLIYQSLTAARASGVNQEQLLNLWEEGKKSPYYTEIQNKLAPGMTVKEYLRFNGMTQQTYNAAQASVVPQNMVYQLAAAKPMMGNAVGNITKISRDLMEGNLSDGERESLISQMGILQQYALPQQLAEMGPTAARNTRRAMAAKQMKLAQSNPNVQGAQEMAQMAAQEMAAANAEELQYLQQRAKAAFDYQKQTSRAWEDYYQERGWAQEDFQQQQAWAEDDYLRQRQYTLEDFHRQQRYSEQDFATSMTRMAEDTAKGMINPWQRMQSQGIWSLEGMNQNVEEQQKWLRDQLRALEELKRRGLSQQAIDTFGLADPGKAQQVAYYATADNDELEKTNRLARRQARLGKKFSDPELNQPARRAVEDFERNQGRARESMEITLGRMDEAFKISTERAVVQFTKQMDRMAQKMSKTMGRMHQDFLDQDKEVIANKRQLMRVIEDVYQNRTAKWGPIFGTAMGQIKQENTKGLHDVTQDSTKAIAFIGAGWRKFSVDGTVPSGANPFTDTGVQGKASPAADSSLTKATKVSGSTGKSGKQGGAQAISWGTGSVGRSGGGDSSVLGKQAGAGGPVSGVGGTGDWGKDLKAKYTALADALVKYGPLNRVGLVKGGKMKGGGTKAAMWLWQQMLADGLTPQQAGGILGNLDQESGFSPSADEAGGPGRGIAQWGEGARWDQLLAFAKVNKMDPMELGTQYAFMKHEMDTGAYKFSWADFNAQKDSVQGSAKYFGSNYEGFGIEGARNSDADYWYSKFKKVPAGTKKADDKWKSAGLWDIGDEIVRRGKEYEKLLDQIKEESAGWAGGTQSLSAAGVKSIDGVKLRLSNSIGPDADVMSVRTNTNGLYYNSNLGRHSVGWARYPNFGVNDIGGGGIPVFAYALGKVVHAGPFSGGSYSPGSTVDLVHLNKGQTRYAHMDGLRVRVGDIVQPGDRLGTSGQSAGHLHFEWQGMPMLNQRGTGEKVPWLALGGVATKPTRALIAEAGHNEAVIPLNSRGVGTIAEAIGKYAMTYEAKVARTAQHGTATVTNTTYVQDYSTQVNGPVEVRANDPDEFLRQMESRQRRQNIYAVSGKRSGRR
jgi:TP901 family phage tail tape measure protein